jgi:hypothetical protein
MADRVESGSDTSLWYRLGYALERGRSPTPRTRLKALAERLPRRNDAHDGVSRPGRRGHRNDDDAAGRGAVDFLLAAGAGTLTARVLELWPSRGSPGVLALLRAGLAGAGAVLLRRLLAPILEGERPGLDDDVAEALAAGAARGLLYAAVIEPRLPGGPVLQGAVYGSVEYAVSPWGGLTKMLGKHAPHRRVPMLAGLFEGYDPSDDTYLDHLAFAVSLAVLYDALVDGETYLPAPEE